MHRASLRGCALGIQEQLHRREPTEHPSEAIFRARTLAPLNPGNQGSAGWRSASVMLRGAYLRSTAELDYRD